MNDSVIVQTFCSVTVGQKDRGVRYEGIETRIVCTLNGLDDSISVVIMIIVDNYCDGGGLCESARKTPGLGLELPNCSF